MLSRDGYRSVWATVGAAVTLLATLAMFSAAAQPVSDIDRYLERADQETREGAYEAAATTLDLVLALYSLDEAEIPLALFMRHAEASYRAGRFAAAAESATRFLLASDLPVEQNQQVLDLVKSSEAAMARQREAQWVQEAAQQVRDAEQQAQRLAETAAQESRSAGTGNGPQACEVPGFPRPADVQSLGLNWCPSNVDFQLRAIALQAAGAWCAILGGTSSTPEQIAARHSEIGEICDRLDALDSLSTVSCRCPSGYRP